MNISKYITEVVIFQPDLHGSAPTGGWIAEEGRVLRRVRNRSCTMYSTVAAQEQGARLPASRHRRLYFSQKIRQ